MEQRWSNPGPGVYRQLLRRDVKRFRGGLVFKAHTLLCHSTLGFRVIEKKKSTRLSHQVHPWGGAALKRSPQTATSKVSTGASKCFCQARPRIVAFSKKSTESPGSLTLQSRRMCAAHGPQPPPPPPPSPLLLLTRQPSRSAVCLPHTATHMSTCEQSANRREADHTEGYNPFIKSQLTRTQLT